MWVQRWICHFQRGPLPETVVSPENSKATVRAGRIIFAAILTAVETHVFINGGGSVSGKEELIADTELIVDDIPTCDILAARPHGKAIV
jgi:hypothetical protein